MWELAHATATTSPLTHRRRGPKIDSNNRMGRELKNMVKVRYSIAEWGVLACAVAIALGVLAAAGHQRLLLQTSAVTEVPANLENSSGVDRSPALGYGEAWAVTAPQSAAAGTGDLSLAPGNSIALPELSFLGLDDVCNAVVQVQNVSGPSGSQDTIAILITWGDSTPCAGAPGPIGVECSGILKPGSAWSFTGPTLPVGSKSGFVYSFSDDVAVMMCDYIKTNVITEAAYRTFHKAYLQKTPIALKSAATYRGEPLAVAVNKTCPADQTPGQLVGAAYEGVSEPMREVKLASGPKPYRYQVPLVMAERAGMNTVLSIQNAGVLCAAVELLFVEQDSCVVPAACSASPVAIPIGQSLTFDPLDCVGSNWQGNVEIRSDAALAIVADIFGLDTLSAYRAVPAVPSPGSEELIGPLYYRPEYGWDTHVHVQNLGTDVAQVQVSFYRSDGSIASMLLDTICVGGSREFMLPVISDQPGNETGWIRVESQPGPNPKAQPVAAVARLVKYSDAARTEAKEASAYTLLPAQEIDGTRNALPLAFKEVANLVTDIQLLRLLTGGGSPVADHQYYDGLSSSPKYQYPLSISPGETFYENVYNFGLIDPDFRGSAIIKAANAARYAAAGVVRSQPDGEDIPGDEAGVYIAIPTK